MTELTQQDQKLIRVAVLYYLQHLTETDADKEIIDYYEQLNKKLKEITPNFF